MSDPPGPRPAVPVIQVWQEPDRRWRWRYLEPSSDGQPVAFRSTTTAYPDVLVLEREDQRAGAGHTRRGLTRNRLLLVALVAVVVLVLWPRRRPAARGPLLESDRQGQ
jgi:hypothetical protein